MNISLISSIGDIALAPSDPEILYVGTGEANARNSVSPGAGVYRTDDGGKNWRFCGLAETRHVGRIVVHPDNPDIAYVAGGGRLWGPNPERGLYRTHDGGRNWERVLFIDEDTGVVDVSFAPDNPWIVYAASWERRRDGFDSGDPARRWGPGSAIWKSADAGANWKRLEGGLPAGEIGRIGLDVSRNNPGTVYATVANQNPRPPEEPEGGEREGRSPVKSGPTPGSPRVHLPSVVSTE